MNSVGDAINVKEWIMIHSQKIKDSGFAINEHGELCKYEGSKLITLSNFIVMPIEIIFKVTESGGVEESKYVFDGILKNEKRLKRIEVSISDLINTKWIRTKWSPFCEVYSNEKKNYNSILQFIDLFAKKSNQKIEFDTIGWHKHENKWFFLHSDGIIGEANEKIATSNTEFTLRKDDHLSPRESFLESLEMLNICNHKLSYSLLSFLLTSIITTPLLESKRAIAELFTLDSRSDWVWENDTIYFFTNIYEKTNMTRPDAHKTKTIMPGIKEHKDCVFVIDDFGTSKTKENEYSVINKIEDIIRNLTDRQFSSSNISDGMVLITGEKFLDTHNKNESSKKRIIRVKMDNLFNRKDAQTYDASKAELYDKYKDQRHLPTSISHYLEWLSVKLNSSFIDDYKKDFEALRSELGNKFNSHGRHTDSFAHQICAINFYMSYGKEMGFITPEDFVNMCSYAKKIFGELLEDQEKTIFDPQVELFLQALKELIIEDKIVVELNSQRLDFNRKVYGVLRREKEQEVLKLDWETVYTMVLEHLSNTQRDRPLIGNKNLAKLLDEYNLICFNEHGTTTPFSAFNRTRGKAERCRVINFKANKIADIKDIVYQKNISEVPIKMGPTRLFGQKIKKRR